MRYPEGSEIKVGDLVWWNEGQSLGYVQVIAATGKECEEWGLEAPHMFVANRHPFDPELQTGVGHDEACLADEGVAPLTGVERELLQSARAKATSMASPEFNSLPFAVETEVAQGKFVAWIFTAFKQDGTTEVVKILGSQ